MAAWRPFSWPLCSVPFLHWPLASAGPWEGCSSVLAPGEVSRPVMPPGLAVLMGHVTTSCTEASDTGLWLTK